MKPFIRRRNFLLSVCGAIIMLLTTPVSALTLFGNAGSGTGSGFASNNYSVEYAVGFTVPAGPNVVVNSVTLSLARMESGSSFYADVQLRSNAGGNPGNYFATIGSAEPATTSFADYQMTGPWTLMANTTYWLVVQGNYVYVEGASNAPSGQFTYAGVRSRVNYGSWGDPGGPFIISLADATPAAATVSSIARSSPSPTNGASVGWSIQFSDAVADLTAANFELWARHLSPCPSVCRTAGNYHTPRRSLLFARR